ncbi:hypothetical protein K7H92_13695 [Pseudomonas stutzeri]|uniref:Uncharacterized protein n=1 Tax=Stutzerimonas frequens TaxID=2968969 RepID=A0AA47E525_9GAMM|nr:hypothetical protein [Stutzerimonas frequens]MCD1639771.1 hypothetical protein [Stutzerimonas stutzeri]WAE54304.1 hypothetical protein OSV15_09140 [Stutzerimonas frequens]
MGWNDHLNDDYDIDVQLPDEAGQVTANGFEPDDDWLRGASRELQIAAMRRWFKDRFVDPAHETPYCSEEGGYIFVYGGPYDPNDEIQSRFSDFVEYEVMEDLIHDLWMEVGDEWASRDGEIDAEVEYYDDALSIIVATRNDPYAMLEERLEQIGAILSAALPVKIESTIIQLAYSSAITALESYLWDTATYWVTNNREVFRRFIETNTDIGKKTLAVKDVFTKLEKLAEEVEGYLRDFVWHRLEKVKPIFEESLEIKMPNINSLMPCVLVRHDIIHRGGRDKDGNMITVSADDTYDLKNHITEFAAAIERELSRRYPIGLD